MAPEKSKNPVPAKPTPATSSAPAAASAPASSEVKEVKVKKPKLPRFGLKLRDSQKNTLRFSAKQREKDAISFATYSVRDPEGKKTHSRGMSAIHDTFEAAKAAAQAGADAAVKIGWILRRGGGGVKSDSFTLDALPAPKQ